MVVWYSIMSMMKNKINELTEILKYFNWYIEKFKCPLFKWSKVHMIKYNNNISNPGDTQTNDIQFKYVIYQMG